MRILFVSPRYPPHVGGVEYVVRSIAERLVRRGHEVTVLSGEPDITRPREEVINGVYVIRWPVWSPSGAYHIPRARGDLERLYRRYVRDSDVVHFHSVHSVFTVLSINMLKEYEIHKVLTPHYHGTGHTVFRRAGWLLWKRIVRKLMKDINVVHSVSKTEANLISRDFSANPIIIRHGVEEWISSIKWEPLNYAMYSGRIEKYKNIDRLGKIVKFINERGISMELRIFGTGRYISKLRRYLNSLSINYQIKPPLPYNEYIHTLSRASFLGLLSEREAFGMVVNEASAIGVPVVVVRPWGSNFADRTRTLITTLDKSDREIAEEIIKLLETAMYQPRPRVITWEEVIEEYLKFLYLGG